jgi:deoxyhypusine synthase
MDVKDFAPKKQTVDELIKQLNCTSFNARKLAQATDVFESMIKDEDCTKFLGLAGALVPAGMRECITEMIKNKWIDVIVSTGANVTHDLAISLGKEKYYQCEPKEIDDKKMREKSISRIYDIISPDESSVEFEKKIQNILKKIPEGIYASYEIIEKIGSEIKDNNSVVMQAAKNKVKIIVPAFFDSIIGIQLWMHTQDRRISIDERKDLDFLINLNYDLKKKKKNSGALILGGGVPKNFILQSVIVPDKPHKYLVQVTTDIPEYGGLSGASLEEAMSWGKLEPKGKYVMLHCDATIALPIIVSALKERL